MSSRKRKHSPTAEKSGTLSKRARILSDLWKSQEEAIESSSTSTQLTPSGPVYRIKAIVGEKGNKYLVDWADDPITGEKFKPDWVSRTSCMPYCERFCDQSSRTIYSFSSKALSIGLIMLCSNQKGM